MKPGAAFWFWHLLLGVLVLCVVQVAVLTVAPSDAAQIAGAGAVAAVFLAAGLRVRLRVDPDRVVITNPWTSTTIQPSEVEAITPQAVRDKQRVTNCLAIRQRGAEEGWPVIATYRLADPRDGRVRQIVFSSGELDASRWQPIAEAIGVPISEWPANPAWRPGSSKRRRPPRQ